jgi:hypothetical protein
MLFSHVNSARQNRKIARIVALGLALDYHRVEFVDAQQLLRVDRNDFLLVVDDFN